MDEKEEKKEKEKKDIVNRPEKKNVAIKMVVNGVERDVSFEELALSNNLAQESLVRLLIEKGLFKPNELLDIMEKVKKERYRQPE